MQALDHWVLTSAPLLRLAGLAETERALKAVLALECDTFEVRLGGGIVVSCCE